MPALESLCRRFDVPLIEDSAEALGATHRGQAAGSFGVAGIFSFNGNKIITTSGGGMLVTQSRQFAEQARHLASQAREPFSHFEHTTVGYNYRLSNLLAALGRAQLRGLDSRIERRKRIDAAYTEALASLPGVSLMPRTAAGTGNYWLTCILIDSEIFGTDREGRAVDPRDGRHRVPTDVEAPPPPASLLRGHIRRTRALRPCIRPRTVPAHRVGALVCRPVPSHRDHHRSEPSLTSDPETLEARHNLKRWLCGAEGHAASPTTDQNRHPGARRPI